MVLFFYVLMWVYVLLLLVLLGMWCELIGYCVVIVVICFVGLVIFYFWLMVVLLVDIDWIWFFELDFLKNIDVVGNVCFFLYVIIVVFFGVWLYYLLCCFGVLVWLFIFNWVWCIGIVYLMLVIC